jgi:hypothetical protein
MSQACGLAREKYLKQRNCHAVFSRFSAASGLVLAAASVQAGEMTLEYEFVTCTTDVMTHQVRDGEDDMLEAAKAIGYADFADGVGR